MKLLFYHPDQNALRVYDTDYQTWEDMVPVLQSKRFTSLVLLISYGWELVGEI